MCKLERKRYVWRKVNSQNNSCENTFTGLAILAVRQKKKRQFDNSNMTAIKLACIIRLPTHWCQVRTQIFLWIVVNLKISKWICSLENDRLWECAGKKWSWVSGGKWGGVTRWNAVRMSKSLPDSTNPLAYEVLPPVINCLMNMHKDSNEIGQNNAS